MSAWIPKHRRSKQMCYWAKLGLLNKGLLKGKSGGDGPMSQEHLSEGDDAQVCTGGRR